MSLGSLGQPLLSNSKYAIASPLFGEMWLGREQIS